MSAIQELKNGNSINIIRGYMGVPSNHVLSSHVLSSQVISSENKVLGITSIKDDIFIDLDNIVKEVLFALKSSLPNLDKLLQSDLTGIFSNVSQNNFLEAKLKVSRVLVQHSRGEDVSLKLILDHKNLVFFLLKGDKSEVKVYVLPKNSHSVLLTTFSWLDGNRNKVTHLDYYG